MQKFIEHLKRPLTKTEKIIGGILIGIILFVVYMGVVKKCPGTAIFVSCSGQELKFTR